MTLNRMYPNYNIFVFSLNLFLNYVAFKTIFIKTLNLMCQFRVHPILMSRGKLKHVRIELFFQLIDTITKRL